MSEAVSNKKFIAEEAKDFALDEYREHVAYSLLARVERDPRRRELLLRLAGQEYEHFQFWNRFAGVQPSRPAALLWASAYLLLRLIFGITFAAKLMERGERRSLARYRAMERHLEGEDLEALRRIIRDEESHELGLISQMDETIVRYMGALVLGLADAIIEITAAHAGTLGTTDSTIVAGVIGLIVGVGASISMASASYLQARHETGKSPTIAAAVTGVGYMAAVALMSLPYFVLHGVYAAFFASLAVAVALAFLLTFQASVYADTDFRREFAQTTALLLGTAFLTYYIGDLLGGLFGIRGHIA